MTMSKCMTLSHQNSLQACCSTIVSSTSSIQLNACPDAGTTGRTGRVRAAVKRPDLGTDPLSASTVHLSAGGTIVPDGGAAIELLSCGRAGRQGQVRVESCAQQGFPYEHSRGPFNGSRGSTRKGEWGGVGDKAVGRAASDRFTAQHGRPRVASKPPWA